MLSSKWDLPMTEFSDHVTSSNKSSHSPERQASIPQKKPAPAETDDHEITRRTEPAEWFGTVPLDEKLLANLTGDHRLQAWSLKLQNDTELLSLKERSKTERMALIERSKTERVVLSWLLGIMASSVFSSGALLGLAAWRGVKLDTFAMWSQTAIATQIGLLGAASVFYKKRTDNQ